MSDIKSKERKPFDLYDWVTTTAEIQCDNCGKKDEIIFADDPVDYFFDEGWRATKNKCYCPSCAKKNLKNL